MARAGTNLRTNYLESNEVLRRPYQKLLIAHHPGGCARCCRPRSSDLFRASDQSLLSRLHRRARPDDADRLLRPDLARPCRLSRDRRVHDRHPDGACRSCRSSSCVPAAAAVRRLARLHRRPAVAALSRCLSRDQHACDALRHHLSRAPAIRPSSVRARPPASPLPIRSIGPLRAARRVMPGTISCWCCSRSSPSAASIWCAPGPAAPGWRFATATSPPRRSASISPATSCSPSC